MSSPSPDSLLFYPAIVDVTSSVEEIASKIRENGRTGLLAVKGLDAAPLDAIRTMLDGLATSPSVVDSLNTAHARLVYKDAYANGQGGADVDQKRVLDISPERLKNILLNSPDVLHSDAFADGSSLDCTLEFFFRTSTTSATKLLQALAIASGSKDVLVDAEYNFRMVDYYARSTEAPAPRCGEHRDFGSFTLIFADRPGLQVFLEGEWMSVAPLPPGTAILLFGWVTQIRSNDRISAALHRVVNEAVDGATTVPRRTAAVLFCAPKMATTPLEPVLLYENETRNYIAGLKVGQLRGNMRRKWNKREGMLSQGDRELELAEIMVQKLVTQDDVVRKMASTSSRACSVQTF